MKKAVWRPLALIAALAVLPLAAASAEARAPGPLSADVVAAMGPVRQGEVLEPLRVVADAAARVGRGAQADVYTQVEMAADYRSVNLYLTDPDRRAAFLDAVHKADPEADTKLLNVRRSAKSRQQLRKDIKAVVGRRDLPFTIATASSTVDGSAIDLGVDDPEAARRYLAQPAVARRLADAGSTPVRVRPWPASVPLSSRWDDSWPFKAGAALGPTAISGFANCTSGIPTQSTLDNRQWLITSSHCYSVGEAVTTGAGTYIGRDRSEDAELDAAFIDAGTGRSTWDGLDAQGYTRYLNGVRNVAVGDFVCQLGYNTKVFCNIRTEQAGDASWVLDGVTTFGSIGVPHYGGWLAQTGDSGGPVITINDQDSRQLNGMVSVGFGCNHAEGKTLCNRAVGWVDVYDILDRHHLVLAP
ncbi:S1 family peptidase [Streptomyces sp. NBC_00435]|uniref:hypothetical protein n=1 Tax=Streptomyces sp. NBC_00435 TaxID=2903649 RepID=UPI002E1CB24D